MLSARGRIWLALMLRDIRSRRGRTAESFLLSLVEPLAQLFIVYYVFASLGRRPDFGESLLLFLVTGVLPYFLFTHVVGRIMGAIRMTTPLLPLGTVSVVDVAIAQLILETLIVTVVGVAVLGGLFMAGVSAAQPDHVDQLVLAILMTTFVAFGVGIFNASVVVFFTAYRLVWTLVARSLLFFSSVFFVVESLPPDLRGLLWWNPLLHGVIWFRTGIYAEYPTDTLSQSYMIGFGLVITLLGLAIESMVRRRA